MTMTSASSITVIVPVYNEALLVEEATTSIVEFMRARFRDPEIIVVESGSTDGSGELCDRMAERFPEVSVIHEGARRGFGSAMKAGFKAASRELVTMTTLDLPFPLECVVQAAAMMDHHDCVLSYRSADARKSVFRKIQSWVFNNALKQTLGLRTRHLNSALKVYRRDLIQSLPLRSNGWFIDTEIIYWLERRGVRSTEIPVPLIERRVGKSSTGLTTPLHILREAYEFSRSVRKAEDLR